MRICIISIASFIAVMGFSEFMFRKSRKAPFPMPTKARPLDISSMTEILAAITAGWVRYGFNTAGPILILSVLTAIMLSIGQAGLNKRSS